MVSTPTQTTRKAKKPTDRITRADSTNHQLDKPRVGLALGLFSAAGIGISLMQPNLFWVGAAICYFSGFLTLGRYYSALKVSLNASNAAIRKLEASLICLLISAEILIPSYLIANKIFLSRTDENHIYVEEAQDGAYINIYPADEIARVDGTFSFPIYMVDSGKAPVGGMNYIFSQVAVNHVMTVDEEDNFMKDTYKEFYGQIGSVSQEGLKDSNVTLSRAEKRILVQKSKHTKFTRVQHDNIKNGAIFLYSGAIVVYIDEYSAATGHIYYNEFCARYDAELASYANCTSHNFSKKIFGEGNR